MSEEAGGPDQDAAKREQEEAEKRAGETGAKYGCIGCLGIIVAFFAFVFFASSGSSGGSGADDPAVQRIGAQSACESWVEDQLKSPASAQFSNVEATGFGPWTITGSVDSENSFGASLRSTWSCEVRLDGDMFRGRATVNEG